VLLIASSVLLTFQMIECKPEWKTAFISGLLLGCIPFAKLQATPIGFAIGITQFGLLLGKGWIRIRPVVALIIGASCPAALILLPLARTEGLADFWISYVRWGMMEYARPFTWTSFVLLVDIMRRPETMAYLLSMMLLTAV